MSGIVEEIHARVSEKLSEIEAICAEYKYDVTLSLLLRHSRGPSHSMLISNDSPNIVVLCIAELSNIGEVIEEDQPESEPK
jgi:hypothetical protein